MSTSLTSPGTAKSPTTSSPGTSGPWRPKQWGNKGYKPPLTLTTQDPTLVQQTIYVFDTTIRAEHHQPSVVTLNPVQSGAAISDHAYVLPARLTVEIAMSNSMQAYTVGQWANGPSKAVAAYQTLVALQAALNPVSVATRLNTYTYMMITDILAEDDKETLNGLKAVVTFTQIITATISVTSATGTAPASTIPQSTTTSQGGQPNTQPVPSAIQQNNNISNAAAAGVNTTPGSGVPGSGNWSSTPVSGLTPSVLPPIPPPGG